MEEKEKRLELLIDSLDELVKDLRDLHGDWKGIISRLEIAADTYEEKLSKLGRSVLK